MATINRFEIGGIFYDCEDLDAQNKITALQRQMDLNYGSAQNVSAMELADNTQKVLFTAQKRGVVFTRAYATVQDDTPQDRYVNIYINGTPLFGIGNLAAYPGVWTLGEFPLKPGDVLSVQKNSASSPPVTVGGTFVPYYE